MILLQVRSVYVLYIRSGGLAWVSKIGLRPLAFLWLDIPHIDFVATMDRSLLVQVYCRRGSTAL